MFMAYETNFIPTTYLKQMQQQGQLVTTTSGTITLTYESKKRVELVTRNQHLCVHALLETYTLKRGPFLKGKDQVLQVVTS